MPDINELLAMRQFFKKGNTKKYEFRKEQLLRLKDAIVRYEKLLHEALYKDLKKSPEECWVTETGFVVAEISNTIRHLKKWMQADAVKTNLLNFPSKSLVLQEPLGTVLIIAPWNYPFQLLFTPLVGAIAAGNCVVLKPSEFAPATEAVMKKMIEEIFDCNYIKFVEGDGAVVVPEMMNNFIFDHVFYTGSTAIGKIIYQMAAKNLVPVTLELGGKSPCIVEDDADIMVSAKRIAIAKFSNAGQMCVAPDYVLVHASKKDALIDALKICLQEFFDNNAEESYNYGKIINRKQFDRLVGYLNEGKIIAGGKINAEHLFIEPTIMVDILPEASIMKDEIFGPILPIISFDTVDQAKEMITNHPNPLAFYIFTSSKTKEKQWVTTIPFGGGCVNNASWHLTNHNLPFGGRGFSGNGHYHGKFSFDTFTHKKAIMKTPTWFDPSIKYPPFKGKLKLFKWVIK